jgi:hypothetical protein
MIDRKARNAMVKTIRAYMDEEITAFQLDDALLEVSSETADETVQTIAKALWYFYDDCKDHKIIAGKEEWDYFYRLLLLLESEAVLEMVKSRRKWHLLQGVAGLLLLGFIFLVLQDDYGVPLLVYALPFGPPSMIIAGLNALRDRKKTPKSDMTLVPYESVSALLAVRRSVTGFVKKRYPQALLKRRIRNPIIEGLMSLCFLVMWCMIAPAVLFFQMLPERDVATRVRLSGSSAGV